MYIHDQAPGKYRTVCKLPMHPMMQTTLRAAGDIPTCPDCRRARGLPPLPDETNHLALEARTKRRGGSRPAGQAVENTMTPLWMAALRQGSP